MQEAETEAPGALRNAYGSEQEVSLEAGIAVDAHSLCPPPQPAPPSEYGWLFALAVLCAARLSRTQTQANQFRPDLALVEVEASWAGRRQAALLGKQDKEKRAAEAAERLGVARLRADQRERVRLQQDAALQAAAAKEAERVRAAAEDKRRAFEADEAALAAELQQRTEAERRILEEAAERARAALEQRRRKADEARARLEAERARAEAEAQARAQAELQQREAERRELRRMQKRFAARFEGGVDVSRPAPGTLTEGRLPKPAIVTIAITLGSALGGQASAASEAYASINTANEGALTLAGQAAAAAAERYASSVRLQALGGQGALMAMEEVELQHWMRAATVRTAVGSARALREALQAFASAAKPHHCAVEVRTEQGVLPAGHSRRAEAVLACIVAAVERDDDSSAAAGLSDLMDEEALQLAEGAPAPLPPCTGEALGAAFFLDFMYWQRPAKQVEASPWYEAAGALVRSQLAERTRLAPPDTLGEAAEVISAALGGDHAVARMAAELARANLSSARRAALVEQERLRQAELAEALVQEEWPDEVEAAEARTAAREAATPVPERVWALQNVGSALALQGPRELARARQLLERAVLLKADWVGRARHPGVLGELAALAEVLDRTPDWQADAAGVRARMVSILGDVAERCYQQGDGASACALLEAATREMEGPLGLGHPGVRAASRRAEALFASLSPEERERVSASRRQEGIVRRVIQAYGQARELGEVRSRASAWDDDSAGGLPHLA
ncbi:hypothetical protein WJX81_005191 [Elliptochloris bilobata]|uniref:Uncharacterized protein n=1 Tax=Elliptochloris bilobata TaxID=381761 RepID=A0AAW1R0B8_9CHLO